MDRSMMWLAVWHNGEVSLAGWADSFSQDSRQKAVVNWVGAATSVTYTLTEHTIMVHTVNSLYKMFRSIILSKDTKKEQAVVLCGNKMRFTNVTVPVAELLRRLGMAYKGDTAEAQAVLEKFGILRASELYVLHNAVNMEMFLGILDNASRS